MAELVIALSLGERSPVFESQFLEKYYVRLRTIRNEKGIIYTFIDI
jgi:hypothetical protein